MKRFLKRTALALALVFFLMMTVNSPLFAPQPKGYVRLIAHRGAYQLYSHAKLGRDTCTATRIYPPTHLYHENTLAGIAQARRLGAQMVEIDIAPTKDGKIAVFHDWTLDCRTNGKGNVRDHTMAELKALDATYGYTADDGKTFPFRGQGVGRIPELGEVLAAFPDTPLLFNFKSKDAAEADLLAAALKAAGRDPVARRDGFYAGNEAGPVTRIRALYPKAWTFSMEAAKACTKAYGWQGWMGLVPEICRGRTIVVPLNYQWAMAALARPDDRADGKGWHPDGAGRPCRRQGPCRRARHARTAARRALQLQRDAVGGRYLHPGSRAPPRAQQAKPGGGTGTGPRDRAAAQGAGISRGSRRGRGEEKGGAELTCRPPEAVASTDAAQAGPPAG